MTTTADPRIAMGYHVESTITGPLETRSARPENPDQGGTLDTGLTALVAGRRTVIGEIWARCPDDTPEGVRLDARTVARDLAARWNAHEELVNALDGLFTHCAMTHKHWGEGSNARAAHVAIKSAHTLLLRHKPGRDTPDVAVIVIDRDTDDPETAAERFTFPTRAEADAFLRGIQYVNDSALEAHMEED